MRDYLQFPEQSFISGSDCITPIVIVATHFRSQKPFRELKSARALGTVYLHVFSVPGKLPVKRRVHVSRKCPFKFSDLDSLLVDVGPGHKVGSKMAARRRLRGRGGWVGEERRTQR